MRLDTNNSILWQGTKKMERYDGIRELREDAGKSWQRLSAYSI